MKRDLYDRRLGADRGVPYDEKCRVCPEPDAVVEAQDIWVPCKVEPTEAAGAPKVNTVHVSGCS